MQKTSSTKPKIKVNNRLKGVFGQTITTPGKRAIVEINVKAHKNKVFKKSYTLKQSLADTVKHELDHALHPKKHEKTVYKDTVKFMKKASNKMVDKLVRQLKKGKFNG
jgi:hypothetical protein